MRRRQGVHSLLAAGPDRSPQHRRPAGRLAPPGGGPGVRRRLPGGADSGLLPVDPDHARRPAVGAERGRPAARPGPWNCRPAPGHPARPKPSTPPPNHHQEHTATDHSSHQMRHRTPPVRRRAKQLVPRLSFRLGFLGSENTWKLIRDFPDNPCRVTFLALVSIGTPGFNHRSLRSSDGSLSPRAYWTTPLFSLKAGLTFACSSHCSP